MNGHLWEQFLSLLEVIVSGALTIAGLVVEQAAVANVLSGNAALGLWEVWMGGVALFVGVYLLGYRRFARDWRESGTPR